MRCVAHAMAQNRCLDEENRMNNNNRMDNDSRMDNDNREDMQGEVSGLLSGLLL